MTISIKVALLIIIFVMGFLAANTEDHIFPQKVTNSVIYNLTKIISFTIYGAILGLLGFLIKINGASGGILLIIISVVMIVITIAHLPMFPQLVVVGIRKDQHTRNPFLGGVFSIFASASSLHAIIFIALAHGYYKESALILFSFALGSTYIPKINLVSIKKVLKIFMFIYLIIASLFVANKGLMYTEKYYFSPFENRNVATVPEVLDNIQFLKSDFSTLDRRVIISKGFELNWLIQGEHEGDTIYIPRYKHKSVLNKNYENLELKEKKAGFIYFTTSLGKGDYLIKVMDEPVDVYNLPYSVVMDSGYGDDIHGDDYIIDQNVPDITVTDPGIAEIVNGHQDVEIHITKDGYNPSVVVLKNGVPATLHFIGDELTEDNKRIVMPSYNEYLEFIDGDNPINIPDPIIDFIFYDWKGINGGYILIVDDLDGMTKEKAIRQIRMLNVNGI